MSLGYGNIFLILYTLNKKQCTKLVINYLIFCIIYGKINTVIVLSINTVDVTHKESRNKTAALSIYYMNLTVAQNIPEKVQGGFLIENIQR